MFWVTSLLYFPKETWVCLPLRTHYSIVHGCGSVPFLFLGWWPLFILWTTLMLKGESDRIYSSQPSVLYPRWVNTHLPEGSVLKFIVFSWLFVVQYDCYSVVCAIVIIDHVGVWGPFVSRGPRAVSLRHSVENFAILFLGLPNKTQTA